MAHSLSALSFVSAINNGVQENELSELPPTTMGPDEPEGDQDTASVRVSWGYSDLFDLSVQRVGSHRPVLTDTERQAVTKALLRILEIARREPGERGASEVEANVEEICKQLGLDNL